MKRSEMVKRIRKCLIDDIPKIGYGISEDDLAEKILTLCELDMQPPYDTASDDECPINEWEPEDEKSRN